ncbi:MAG: rhodanese-like domain-containing protein [Pseudomonadota bacterium]
MTRASYKSLAEAAAKQVEEVEPWDLPDLLKERPETLILDVRERSEFDAAHIRGALNVPRGILEAACEWDYFETEPELVEARQRPVVVVCRSGHRSALAALVMGLIGYEQVYSLKLGIKGWNDSDLPLVDGRGLAVDADDAQHVLEPRIPREQLDPARRR